MTTTSPRNRRQQLNVWLADGSARRWRKEAEHTYLDACRRIRVDPSTVRRWELGEIRPSEGTWRRAYGYYNSIKPNENTMNEEELCPPPQDRASASPASAGPDRTAEPASTTSP